MTLITKYRLALSLFMVALLLSGVTAFPLSCELGWLTKWFGIDPAVSPEHYRGLSFWISTVDHGLRDTYSHHPWIAYGTDWLAFAHAAIEPTPISTKRHLRPAKTWLTMAFATSIFRKNG